MVATVVVGVSWKWILAPQGPLNDVLGHIGLGGFEKAWLGDFTWALPTVGLIGTWIEYGLCMVLFLAGVQKIPTSLYDAARVDGAGVVREFFAVTLPNLRNEIAVAQTLTTLVALRSFDLIYVTTKGGPGNATDVPTYELYVRAFETGQVGSAAAIGVVLAVISLAAVVLIRVLVEDRG